MILLIIIGPFEKLKLVYGPARQLLCPCNLLKTLDRMFIACGIFHKMVYSLAFDPAQSAKVVSADPDRRDRAIRQDFRYMFPCPISHWPTPPWELCQDQSVFLTRPQPLLRPLAAQLSAKLVVPGKACADRPIVFRGNLRKAGWSTTIPLSPRRDRHVQ